MPAIREAQAFALLNHWSLAGRAPSPERVVLRWNIPLGELVYRASVATLEFRSGKSSCGSEIDLIVRQPFSSRLFLRGVAGQVWPGNPTRARAQGTARLWMTAQVSRFLGLLSF